MKPISTDAYTIELPYPPSVNTYWRNIGRGRTIVSKNGRDYHVAVMTAVLVAGRPHTFKGRLAVEALVCCPDLRRRDLDNVQKAVFDSLTKARVYEDDSQIDDLHVIRGKVCKPGKVVVSIREIG